MTETLHQRAQQLASQQWVEGLSAADQSWLDQHLATCAECASSISQTADILSALRAVPVHTPSDLAARTQLRVRLRAASMREAPAGYLLWIIAGASWVLGLFTAPLVWTGLTWMGHRFGVPKIALEAGFLLWWAIPALVAVAVVLHQKAVGSSSRI